MPQVLKIEVRARILEAALEIMAAHGYERATMGAIAERAGLGTASLYRYYASKEELFDAVISPDLARRFEQLMERRVRALARNTQSGVPTDDLGGDMLTFWLENRLAVVILLDRAAGTPYAGFGERFVEQLTAHTLTEIRGLHPGVKISAGARFVLSRIFENTRRLLATILEQHADPAAMRHAIEAFWSYHIAGLHGFTSWIGEP
ncbi:TetR/AcrR family transcriptional regulator [Pendulispora brunnea]|uniref:TetR/AcrR family transcriptional regulator n=1 Tax=Pendulispora brunnea TaxID=2905690 RepID=A0ABZ2JV73_9BACT